MTAMNKKVRMSAFVAAVLAAAGCVNEDPVYIGPEICPPAETGYLTMSSIGLYVVVDSETDQETEQSPATMSTRTGGASTDAKTGITRGSEAAKEDEYIVTITSRDAAEPVFRGSYAALKAAIAANEKGMEVPVGMYDISATSNLSVAGAPDDVQASPSYAGAVDGVSVAKDVATQVETVVCKLQNIKITVGVAADLYDQLDVLDPATDPVKKIEAKVYYGDKEHPTVEWKVPDNWDWTADDAKAVYFPVLNEKNNTLHFSFCAKTKGGKAITMNKDISGILKGQWRRIHVIPRYDTTGNLTFDVTVSAFVQDETIVIGDDGTATTMYWTEKAYVDPDDPSMAAPSIRWADGSELPETITIGGTMLQNVVILAPNEIEKVALEYRTTNPDMDYSGLLNTDDLCASSGNPTLINFGIPYGADLAGRQEATVELNKLAKQLAPFDGEYAFTFTVIDKKGFICEQTLRFVCGAGGNSAPQVVWQTGTLFDDEGFNADGTEMAGAKYVEMYDGMDIGIQLSAYPNFEAIRVTISSDVLDAGTLALAGLATSFDLCDLQDFDFEGDTYSAENQAKALKETLGLIDKVNDELKQERTASFNITGFVPMMKLLGGGAKFQFALTVVDAEGRSTTKYLRLRNPEE